MAKDPNVAALEVNSKTLAASTKALEENGRAIARAIRVLETVNANLVELGKILKEGERT